MTFLLRCSLLLAVAVGIGSGDSAAQVRSPRPLAVEPTAPLTPTPAPPARARTGAVRPGMPDPTAPRTVTVPGDVPSRAAAVPAEDARQSPDCSEVRRKARFNVYFDKVDIEKLVQTVSDATCKTFILGDNVRGKVSIIGPDNGKVEVDADQFYAAFLAALDANQLAVVPYGRFSKIVEKAKAKQSNIPTVLDDSEPYSTNEQMVTRMFKVRYVDLEPLRAVVQQLVSQNGDSIPFQPDTLIVNDLGSNMHRLERIIDQLDTRAFGDEMRVIPVRYASVTDVANTVQKLFEQKTRSGGGRGAFGTPAPAPAPAAAGVPAANAGQAAAAGQGGPATVSTIIPDERTNKLILVASPSANERIDALLREIDVPITGEGRINVYALSNANAEDIAATLQSLSQGTSNRPRTGQGGNLGGAPPPGGLSATQTVRPLGVTAAELFAGEVKISPDKATNSLVVVASQNDFKSLVRVIEKLDIPRRQVFVEAVIMEVNLDRQSSFGLNLHQGYTLGTPEGTATGIVGTKYTVSGVPPSFSIANLANFGGFLAGLQGPTIPAFDRLGLSIPSFGIVLHALQQSSDVNVLSTPHLLTSDNEEAEITVGQNVPFQAGFAPSSLGSLTGATTGTTGTTGQLGQLGGLGTALGGLGSLFAPINRQNVELKLTIKPQINASDFIRLVINESTEEIASQDPVLGPTTSKRTAKTTVVAKDQETVVIGGIMQERTISSVSKVPILGDIPLLGHLFREESKHKVKTNLLLFLTPYIIRDASDFRRIFEQKMAERQKFVEEFYGQVPGYDVPVDFARKAGPFAKINQAVLREDLKVENGGPGLPGEQVFKPGETGAAPIPAPRSPAGPLPAPGAAPPPAATPETSAPPPSAVDVAPGATPQTSNPAPATSEGTTAVPPGPPPDEGHLRVQPQH